MSMRHLLAGVLLLTSGVLHCVYGLDGGHMCTCDLTSRTCDVDCCCDTDCTYLQATTFSTCTPVNAVEPGPSFCSRTSIVAENSTLFIRHVAGQDQILCIDRDNNDYDGFRYPNWRPLVHWPNHSDPRAFSDRQPYKIGHPIWLMRNGTMLDVLRLPEVGIPVRYGQDAQMSWSGTSGQSRDCIDLWPLVGVDILPAAPAVRLAESASVPRVGITTQRCNDGKCNALSVSSSASKVQCWSEQITGFGYDIVHTGHRGILNVTASVHTTSVAPSSLPSARRLSYAHWWPSDNRTRTRVQTVLRPSAAPRAAHQAYSTGQLILLRTPARNGSATGLVHELSLIPSTAHCFSQVQHPEQDRLKVHFGTNVQSGCVLRVTERLLQQGCAGLRRKLLHMLIGHAPPDQLAMTRVAAVPKAGTADKRSWLKPILAWSGATPDSEDAVPRPMNAVAQSHGVCKAMVLSLHLDIFHAQIGSLNRPMGSKIVGVRYKFGRPIDVPASGCSRDVVCKKGPSHKFTVHSSVSFIDLTQAASKRYAEHPIIEARLPHDFFYPFFSSN